MPVDHARRRQRIAELLCEDPTRSDRQIAALVGGCDHQVVGRVRRSGTTTWRPAFSETAESRATLRLIDRLAELETTIERLVNRVFLLERRQPEAAERSNGHARVYVPGHAR